jgi:DNA polymerase delta subunit 3
VLAKPKRGIKREVPESDTEEDPKSDKPATRVKPSSKSSTTAKSKPLPRSASTTSAKSSKPSSKDPVDPVKVSKHSASPAPSVRVKRRILLSDDEEEDEEVVQSSKPAKRAKPAIESNPTKKLDTKVLIDDLSEEDAEVDTKPLKTVHRTSGKRSRDILDSDEEDENGAPGPTFFFFARSIKLTTHAGAEGVSPEEPLSDASEDAPEHVPLSKNEARRKLKDPRVKAAPKVKEEIFGIDAAVKREKEAAKKALKKEVNKGKLKTRTYTNARGMLGTSTVVGPLIIETGPSNYFLP